MYEMFAEISTKLAAGLDETLLEYAADDMSDDDFWVWITRPEVKRSDSEATCTVTVSEKTCIGPPAMYSGQLLSEVITGLRWVPDMTALCSVGQIREAVKLLEDRED